MSRVVFRWDQNDYRKMVLELLALPPAAKTAKFATYLSKVDFDYIKNVSEKYVQAGWKLPYYQAKVLEEQKWRSVIDLPRPPTAAPATITTKQKVSPEVLAHYLIDGERGMFEYFWSLASNQEEIVAWNDHYIVRYVYYYYGKLGCLFEKWERAKPVLATYRQRYGISC